VSKESGGLLICSVEPVPCQLWSSSQSFELLHGPSNEMLVDAPRYGVQLGAVERSVVVDPAANLSIDAPGKARQIRSAATVEVPVPDLFADRLLRLGADGWRKAHKEPLPTLGQASPEGVG
jgi:hypothetical protein